MKSLQTVETETEAALPSSHTSEVVTSLAPSQTLITALLSKRGLIVALLLLVIAAFANSIGGSFVHDDKLQIQNNPLFGRWDWNTISRPLTHDHWAALRPEQAGDRVDSYYYRPMFGLFLMGGYQIAGRSPLLWHLITILLHAAAAILLFIVLDKSLARATDIEDKSRRMLAVLAAGIFAVHPAQSESVAWISGLVNPLSAIFLFGAFYFYLSYREESDKSLAKLAASLGLFAAASLTKESALTLVLIVAAYEIVILNRGLSLFKRARIAATQAAPYALIGAAYLAARYGVLGLLSGRNQNANFPDDAVLTLADNLRTLPALLVAYIKVMLFPFGLSFIYDFHYVRSLSLNSFWVPLVGVLAIICAFAYLAKRMPEIKLALIWMVIPLLPHLSTLVFASDELIHDRYLYVPLAGAALIPATLVIRAGQISSSARRWAMCASVVLLAVLCVGTIFQNKQWRNDEALWANAASHAPNSRMVHIALGSLAEARQDSQAALQEYEAALRINPDIIDALNNVAFVEARVDRWDDASRHFERIVELTPNKPVAHFNLSFVYAVKKRYAEAIREQKAAIDLDPNGARAGEWRSRLAQLEKNLDSSSKPGN